MDVDLRFDVIVSQTIGEGVEDEISSFFSLLLKSNAMGPFISRSTCSLTVICETLHLHQCCYHQCCYQWFTIASGSWHSFVFKIIFPVTSLVISKTVKAAFYSTFIK